MAAKKYVGSVDQGTTSTRFMIFDKEGGVLASHQVRVLTVPTKRVINAPLRLVHRFFPLRHVRVYHFCKSNRKGA